MTVIAAATTIGMFGGVSPAFAGAGVSTGSSTISASNGGSTPPFCIKTSSAPTITLNNVGTIDVAQTSPPGAGEYVGGSRATINLPVFYFGPQGTYPDDRCTDNTAPPAPTPVSSWSIDDIVVAGVSGVGTLSSCGGTNPLSATNPTGDFYLRVTNAYTIKVSGSCTITDPVIGAVTGPVTFVFTGNQNPCLESFSVPTCTGVLDPLEFQGVYDQVPA